MDKNKLLTVLNNIEDDTIQVEPLKVLIDNGEIKTVKELLKAIKEHGKVLEARNREDKYIVTQFWTLYMKEGRDYVRCYLKGKELEFHTLSKKIDIYKGTIRGLFIALSKKKNKILLLFDTKEGVLEVDNNFPLIVRDHPLMEAKVRWYKDGKLGPLQEIEEIDDYKFNVGDLVVANNPKYWSSGDINMVGKWIQSDFRGRSSITDITKCVNKIASVGDKTPYTGALVKLSGKWPWYQIENIEKSLKESKGSIKWYKNGKFGPSKEIEVAEDSEFEIGDRVRSTGSLYYWDGNNFDNPARDDWKDYPTNEVMTIEDVRHIENLKGYTGQAVILGNRWPWFQITNLIKVNER